MHRGSRYTSARRSSRGRRIGEEVGILRAQHGIGSHEALELLSKASQRMNVTVRDVAERISDSGTGLPNHGVEGPRVVADGSE